MVFGVLYWAVWRVILPRAFGYELIPEKEVLEDGTVVTVVSSHIPWPSTSLMSASVQTQARKTGVISSPPKYQFSYLHFTPLISPYYLITVLATWPDEG